MFGLSRWHDLAGMITRRRSGRKARRVANFRGHPFRRARLAVEGLEERRVLSLLGAQLFPSDSPWNQNISSAPVATNSAAIISHIGSSIHLHPDWGDDSPANGSSPLYGIPVNIVHGNSVAKINVSIDNYPDESDITPVPIPPNAVLEGDFQNGPNLNGGGYGENGNPNQRGDSHLLVWDEDNNVAYELYGVSRPNDPTLFPNNNDVEVTKTDNLWHAAQETVWDMKTNTFRTLGATSADAAGLSILAGLVRPDEGLTIAQGGQGVINHALRFTLPGGDVNPQYIYPASHMVSESQGSSKIPFGTRLRLANTPAINTLISNMPPESQIIARAMQQYGLILADIGSAMYVTGASASDNANNQISLTWDTNDIFASNGLKALTAGDFEVVDLTPRVTGLGATSGSSGSAITITGQNFSGAAGNLSVSFGGILSNSVTFVSDTQITAVVPPGGTGTVPVKVQSGVNETDNISDNPNANVTAPIFGYGISAVTPADQFTFVAGISGDANHDGIVNGQDIAVVASNWLGHGSMGDVNFDGIVNGQDIATIASHWLARGGGGTGASSDASASFATATATSGTMIGDIPQPTASAGPTFSGTTIVAGADLVAASGGALPGATNSRVIDTVATLTGLDKVADAAAWKRMPNAVPATIRKVSTAEAERVGAVGRLSE